MDGGTGPHRCLLSRGSGWERVLEKLEVPEMPDPYIIRNSIMEPRYEEIKNKIIPISARSLSSMIRTQGLGNLYEIYLLASRDGINYHLAYIPDRLTTDWCAVDRSQRSRRVSRRSCHRRCRRRSFPHPCLHPSCLHPSCLRRCCLHRCCHRRHRGSRCHCHHCCHLYG